MLRLKIITVLVLLFQIVRPDVISPYFPIKEGLQWKYQVKEKNKSFTQVVKCHLSKDDQQHDFIFATNSIRETSYYYTVTDSTINMVKSKIDAALLPKPVTLDFSKGCPVFQLADKNKSWQWSGKVKFWLFNRHLDLSAEVLGLDTITTDIGEFECLKLALTYKNGLRVSKQLAWYAKNVGLVKFVTKEHRKTIIEFNGM